MCIVIAKHFKDLGWVGVKNRDRSYKPEMSIKKSFRRDIERLLLWDEGTHWTEGVNEYGIAIISGAAGSRKDMNKDEKDDKEVKRSKDGGRVRTALFEKTAVNALDSLIEQKLIGNTFVYSENELFVLESSKRDGGYKFKKRKVKRDEVIVRTNHGIMLPEMGYQEGPNRKSSEERYKLAKKGVTKSLNPDDMLKSMSIKNKDNPQLGTLRYLKKGDDKNTMWTTGQVMCIPSEKMLRYRPIKSEVDFDVEKLNTEKDKTNFEFINSSKFFESIRMDFLEYTKGYYGDYRREW